MLILISEDLRGSYGFINLHGHQIFWLVLIVNWIEEYIEHSCMPLGAPEKEFPQIDG